MKRVLSTVLLILCSSQYFLYGQTIRQFTSDPEKYFQELNEFMTSSFEGGEAIMSEFHAIWKIDQLPVKDQEQIYKNANKALKNRMKEIGDSIGFQYGTDSKKLSDNQMVFIYETSNSMLKKRMKPSHFSDYLLTLINFTTSDQSEQSFSAWQTSLNKLINTATPRSITSYLDFSNNLFAENLLYKSNTVIWKASNKNYTFGFDSLPNIVFKTLDLICLSKKDSSIIYNTTGVYYPTENLWIGRGGKVNWLRTGIPENVINATLTGYQIELKSPGYTADSVLFVNTRFFNKPLRGKIIEKIKADVDEENASYPRFISDDKRLVIKNLFENVDYDGGFSMEGSKLIGLGSKEQDAYLTFKFIYHNDTINKSVEKFLVAASEKFVIESDNISSSKSAVTIHIQNDSIYHPQLRLRFLVKKINDKIIERELILIRETTGLAQTPFSNSYHKVDMNFGALYWDIDDPKMDFWKIRDVGKESMANFASEDYYRSAIYEKIQGMDEVHPLVQLKQLSKKYNDERSFYTYQFSDFIRSPITDVRQSLMHLANMGFLVFNFDEDRFTIKDKVFDYLSANAGRQDYDVINFISNTENKKNASFNLLNFDLNINGVKSIFLSDSQNVYIYPAEQKIVLKKNRDFIFDGQVHAGLFDFFGKMFSFKYDNFKLKLDNVDSLRLSVRGEMNREGEHEIIYVKTVIELINGELLVDEPFNKSGVKPSPTYPIFHSLKDSYVFYERQAIQKGVYKRDSFYFHLEPFTIDSLDNFDPASIALKGNFVSAGIFPDFDDLLGVQPDYSLGFVRPTPTDGFPVYGGKGQYFSQINLSHEGLRGDGRLSYLTSTTKSNDFIFLPDSMNTVARNFENKNQKTPVEFPDVIADSVYIHWEPYQDVMYVYDMEKPMLMFSQAADIHGSLALRPGGMEGNGVMNFTEAQLNSNLIKFKEKLFDADTSEFKLKSDELLEFSFSTDNVNAHVDFVKRQGVFKSNTGGSLVKFPVNQYICFVNEFTWDMEGGSIAMSSDKQETLIEGSEQVVLKGSKFISTHPEQDSLYFFAAKANYDLKNKIIAAEQVKFIHVADARVYPDKEEVVVRKKAKIDPLQNARILANIVTKYHNIYNASVTIDGKKHYNASGQYDYVDELRRKQTIYFNNITVDTTIQTIATGEIKDTANFMLSPNFAFSGTANLAASNQFLNFEGFCKISHKCDKIISHWFQISTDVNPNEIYIPITDSTSNLTNDILSSGIIMDNDSVSVYSTFMSPKFHKSDKPLISAEEFLYYDKSSQEYRISNKDKLIEISLPGNYVSLKTSDCLVYSEGKITLDENIGQVEMTTAGNIFHYLKKDSAVFDLIMELNFFFTDPALKAMANSLGDDINLTPLNFDRTIYERALSEIVGKGSADKLIAEVNLLGSFKKIPDELDKSIVLTDLEMKWDYESKSFISQGPIGIGNIQNRQVNKYVKGYVELLKKKNGDELTLYLEANKDHWYFFTYSRGLMQAISSNEDFNNPIKLLKPAKRKSKVQEKGEMPYQFIISSDRKKKTFLNKFTGE